MEWKLFKDYKEQEKKALEFTERYLQKIQDAKSNVANALAAYEDTLRKEFAGESVSSQKKKALSDIAKAEAAVKVAEEEYSKANDYASERMGKITADDLTNDWNNNVVTTLRRERLAPIVKQAQEGLQAYYGAIQDFINLSNEYKGELEEIRQMNRGRKGAHSIPYPATNFNDLPKHPTDADWDNILRYGIVPEEYRKQEVKANV